MAKNIVFCKWAIFTQCSPLEQNCHAKILSARTSDSYLVVKGSVIELPFVFFNLDVLKFLLW